MNIHLYPVSFRKYSLLLIYAFFFIAASDWCMELYFEKLYGDLTRVGYFSEHDFGWQTPRPLIPDESFKDYPLNEADILVIGDSFSLSRVWQTKFITNGLKISTLTWQDLGTSGVFGSMRSDIGEAVRTAGFKGHYIIIESIERLFQGRMKTLTNEHSPIIKQNIIINPSFPLYPFTQRSRLSLNKLNGADWNLKALHNKIKLSINSSKYFKSGSTVAANFDGCQLFSHRLCNYVLFSDGDFDKETFNSIDNVRIINKKLQAVNIQPIWMIVPDKSTVYLGYGEHNKYPYQNIWQAFAQYPELIAPDLGSAFIQKSRMTSDFYMPNDTHLSTNGFLYLGEFMLSGVRNIKANQTKPFAQYQ